MSTFDYGAYFDPNFYLQQNPDVAKAGVDPRLHYEQSGWREGRNPSPYFDTSDYLSDYQDVAKAGVNPLQHYIQSGIAEGRHPIGGTSPLFDPNYYLTTYPDIKAAHADPAAHYSTIGYKEGRDPSAGFDTTSYYKANPDVAQAFINPLLHYDESGMREHRGIYPAGYDVGGVFGGGTPVGGPVLPSLPPGEVPIGGGGADPLPPGSGVPGTPGRPTPSGLRRALADKARAEIGGFFTSRGASPTAHATDIETRIAQTLAGIQDSDLQDEGLFTGVDQQLFNELQTGYRNKAVGDFNALIGSNTSTLDDPLIASLLSEQRDPANRFISNMLSRGQIDDFGAGRARDELDRQQAIGSTRLNTLGSGLIDTGLSSARGSLGNIGLDAPYSPKTTSDDFMFGLGNQLRAGAGNVFSTAGLPAVAGAQNGPFTSVRTPFKAKGGGGRTPGGGTSTEDTTNVLF